MTQEEQDEWSSWIGQVIVKKSGKPFKSSFKAGTVIRMQINPYSQKMGFYMNDGSVVDCFRCELAYQSLTN